ncbi:hypothetical protein BKA67DRAFT_534775 [Truncatella angustata]|uniref:Uncharacterized protein n=1 Tax=Truncatella angustata TaxID=152316 RepID=A0A9P9A091_9PEZI|nr:uncharacterized protein BKA67DRAFT_534775 [Truncatella angustata]KAH6655870.1 hypothetical protein BKA67DRAFT_534775 [Truncatella angustata]
MVTSSTIDISWQVVTITGAITMQVTQNGEQFTSIVRESRDDTITTAVQAAILVLSRRGAFAFLNNYATYISTATGGPANLDAIFEPINGSVEGMTQNLSGTALISKDIFTNCKNRGILGFTSGDLCDLSRFLYRLVKPVQRYPRTPATDRISENSGLSWFALYCSQCIEYARAYKQASGKEISGGTSRSKFTASIADVKGPAMFVSGSSRNFR